MAKESLYIIISSLVAAFDFSKAVGPDGKPITPKGDYTTELLKCVLATTAISIHNYWISLFLVIPNPSLVASNLVQKSVLLKSGPLWMIFDLFSSFKVSKLPMSMRRNQAEALLKSDIWAGYTVWYVYISVIQRLHSMTSIFRLSRITLWSNMALISIDSLDSWWSFISMWAKNNQ